MQAQANPKKKMYITIYTGQFDRSHQPHKTIHIAKDRGVLWSSGIYYEVDYDPKGCKIIDGVVQIKGNEIKYYNWHHWSLKTRNLIQARENAKKKFPQEPNIVDMIVQPFFGSYYISGTVIDKAEKVQLTITSPIVIKNYLD